MEKPSLLLIKSNPLKSHRPVEALRIGLGLLSGEHRIQIVLMNEAPLLLGEDSEDLVDGEILHKYLPTLKELGQTFYVEETAFKSLDMDETDYLIESINETKIADLLREAHQSMVF